MVAPLALLQHGSAELISLAAEEHRDYSTILQNFPPSFRGDELGTFVRYFRLMVEKLDKLEQNKPRMPKYPANPFHARTISPSQVSLASTAQSSEDRRVGHEGVSKC